RRCSGCSRRGVGGGGPLMAAIPHEDVKRFRGFVAERLGILVDDGRLDDLGGILRSRLAEGRHESLAGYLGRLAVPGAAREELRTLAEHLTVGESYFFRT